MISSIKPYTNKPIINNSNIKREVTFKQVEQAKPKSINNSNDSLEKKFDQLKKNAKGIAASVGFIAALGLLFLLDGLRYAPKKLLK